MCEQFLRVEIRRRHDGFAEADRVRQRAADHLGRIQIRREVDVGRAEIAEQFVEVKVLVDELDVVGEPVFGDLGFELVAVRLTFVAANHRMRLAQDQVERFGMRRDDRRHRVDRVLEPFAAIDQPEGGNRHTRVKTEGALERCAFAERHVRHAVMDDVDLLGIDAVALDEQFASGFREHDDGRRGGAERTRDAQMLGRGVGEDRVQRRDDRLAQAGDEVDDPLALCAAEQAVLVLDIQNIARIGVDEVGDPAVGVEVSLDQPSNHSVGVGAIFAARFVDRDHGTARSE